MRALYNIPRQLRRCEADITPSLIYPHGRYKSTCPLSHLVHRIPPPTQPAPTPTLSLTHLVYLHRRTQPPDHPSLHPIPPLRNLHHTDFAGQCPLPIPRTLLLSTSAPDTPPPLMPTLSKNPPDARWGGCCVRPGRAGTLASKWYYTIFRDSLSFRAALAPAGGWRRSQCSSAHLETLC